MTIRDLIHDLTCRCIDNNTILDMKSRKTVHMLGDALLTSLLFGRLNLSNTGYLFLISWVPPSWILHKDTSCLPLCSEFTLGALEEQIKFHELQYHLFIDDTDHCFNGFRFEWDCVSPSVVLIFLSGRL